MCVQLRHTLTQLGRGRYIITLQKIKQSARHQFCARASAHASGPAVSDSDDRRDMDMKIDFWLVLAKMRAKIFNIKSRRAYLILHLHS